MSTYYGEKLEEEFEASGELPPSNETLVSGHRPHRGQKIVFVGHWMKSYRLSDP